MKTKLLQFITAQCEDNCKATDNRFSTYLDIYRFGEQNGLSNNECEQILKELKKENKITFGRLINGFYIKINK